MKIVLPATMFALTRSLSPAMVWAVVPGVIVAAALVVTDAVSVTAELPAVPLEIYPAETVGVLLTLLLKVSVFVPVDTDAPVAEMVDAGVADPLVIVADAADP